MLQVAGATETMSVLGESKLVRAGCWVLLGV